MHNKSMVIELPVDDSDSDGSSFEDNSDHSSFSVFDVSEDDDDSEFELENTYGSSSGKKVVTNTNTPISTVSGKSRKSFASKTRPITENDCIVTNILESKSTVQPRKRPSKSRNPWTSEEFTALVKGMQKYQDRVNIWASILNDPEFRPILHKRNNLDLKDKARNERRARQRANPGDESCLGIFSMVSGLGGGYHSATKRSTKKQNKKRKKSEDEDEDEI